jgi:amidase
MRIDEYASHDAVGLSDLVRRAEVTPAELQQCALAAHAQVHPLINGVVDAYDEDLSDIPVGGPLAGVPTMVKDLFHGQSGRACGNGSRLSADWVVPQRTQIFARAVAAGMTSIGRTTTSEFGIMGTTETLAQGITSSPWSTRHMAGGSSGGAGAVVGAGVVPVALASDGGGSIRIPASACGVVGLKPSRGRVPWGLHLKEPLLGWAVQFAMTRSVRDAAVLLDVLGGPALGDAEGVPRPTVPFAESMLVPPAPLRIAWWSHPWSGHDADPVVSDATAATAALLEGMGHHVEAATPTFSWEHYLQAMTDVWASTNAHTIDGFAAALGLDVSDRTLEGPTLAMVEYGRTVTAQQLLNAIDVETGLTYLMTDFFSRYDILLTPTLGAELPTVGEYDAVAHTDPRDTFATWSRWESFLPVFNTTGQPAISLPLHMSPDGLPIGMQLVAGAGQEALLLSLSATLEAALPWASRKPPAYVR